MYKHDIDDWILDETELAENYKDIGKPEGFESKMELVGLLEQLKEYKQLEEQGRLIKLPCKVGDTVYKVNKASKKVSQHKVIKFEIDKADATSYTMQIFFENFDFCFLHHFGETVFLTKSEAEAKLKELRGGENESSN